MIKVREASSREVPLLLDMAEAMHAESPRYRDIPLSRRKLTELLERLMGYPLLAQVLVVEKDDEVVGTLWGYVDQYFFSEEGIMASDLLLYITPEKRGGMAAVRLVKAFEEWAVERGALNIQPGVSTGIANESYARFYEALGYTITGYNLSKAASDV